MTSHLPCHILLARSKSQVMPTLKGIQRHEHQEAGITGDSLESGATITIINILVSKFIDVFSYTYIIECQGFFFFFKFIYVLWESEWVGKGRERERQNSKQALCCQRRAWLGAWTQEPWCEIMTWAEIKSRTPNWLSHPGALNICFEAKTRPCS